MGQYRVTAWWYALLKKLNYGKGKILIISIITKRYTLLEMNVSATKQDNTSCRVRFHEVQSFSNPLAMLLPV